MGAFVHDHARNGVVGVVILTPMAKHHVRPGDSKCFDEGVSRLDRIDEKFVVEAEPDQLRSDYLRGVDRLLMPKGGDLVFRKRRGADVAVGGRAEPDFMPLFDVQRRRTAGITFNIVRMSTTNKMFMMIS